MKGLWNRKIEHLKLEDKAEVLEGVMGEDKDEVEVKLGNKHHG